MDFPTMYSLWVSAQQKANSVNGLTVSVNAQEGRIECKIGQNVFYTSTDLTQIHIALDTALAINAIINP